MTIAPRIRVQYESGEWSAWVSTDRIKEIAPAGSQVRALEVVERMTREEYMRKFGHGGAEWASKIG